jgi:hypothetical protein
MRPTDFPPTDLRLVPGSPEVSENRDHPDQRGLWLGLRLSDGSSPPAAGSPELTELPRRPGDRYERFQLDACLLRELAAAAARRQLELDSAAGLVLERRLISRDLSAAVAIQALDQAACEATTRVDLSHGSAVYAKTMRRALTAPRSSAGATPPPSGALALPLRLSDRLRRSWPPKTPLLEVELDSALTWEIAALQDGLTMSEWAFRTALCLVNGRAPGRAVAADPGI